MNPPAPCTPSTAAWEYPVFLTFASVVLWLLGDGAFTLRSSWHLAPVLRGV